jgi:prolyl-tRNA editing enzyme YbaK/EbsC (Cys-tRNA(Pro) deacylase)
VTAARSDDASLLDRLAAVPPLDRVDLLAPSVRDAIAGWTPDQLAGVGVTEIDPDLADTAAFCERYGVLALESANCVVIAGRRGEVTTLVACVVLATTRADVNGLVRRSIDAKKASFAPMDVAVEASGMEYGGITPVGLPPDWPLLIDSAVAASPAVVVGSGVRRSKLVLPGSALAGLPGAQVVEGLGVPNQASGGSGQPTA